MSYYLLLRSRNPTAVKPIKVDYEERFDNLLENLQNQTTIKKEIVDSFTDATDQLDPADQAKITADTTAYEKAYETATFVSLIWSLCGIDFGNRSQNYNSFGSHRTSFLNMPVDVVPFSEAALEAEIACIEGDIAFSNERIGNGRIGNGRRDPEFSALMNSFNYGEVSEMDLPAVSGYLLSTCFTDLLIKELGAKVDDEDAFRIFCNTGRSVDGGSDTRSVKKYCAMAVCHLTEFELPNKATQMFRRHHNFSAELLHAGIVYLQHFRPNGSENESMTIPVACALTMVQMMGTICGIEGLMSTSYDLTLLTDQPELLSKTNRQTREVVKNAQRCN